VCVCVCVCVRQRERERERGFSCFLESELQHSLYAVHYVVTSNDCFRTDINLSGLSVKYRAGQRSNETCLCSNFGL
jgi:hypothetical protein